jgi:hypothetical protein
MRLLRENLRRMTPEQINACWQKGITLAALSLAQSES